MSADVIVEMVEAALFGSKIIFVSSSPHTLTWAFHVCIIPLKGEREKERDREGKGEGKCELGRALFALHLIRFWQ